ncbi:hypothetical protein QR680_016643 [Steinernema hermaphroditum]|uniref:MULE transposase domain-containing protein n=1 Tax=Steinernema hermaphroditum TaxID=289476 RepID=A0AA39HE02_9BILA|nr:hypothetical protein QR680_016643 [Steinernema hermaphroditum]
MASNVFLSDPIDPLLEHVCEPREREEVLGMQVRREAIAKLKKNGGRIGATFTELPQRVLEKHSEESSVIKDNIRGHACGSSEVTKRTFRRARAQRFPTVKSLDEIPDQYSVTMAGLNSQHNDPVYQEKLLIFKSPEIAIFMSPYGTPDTLWQLGEGGSDPTAILLELRDCFTPDLHSEDFFPFARFTDVLDRLLKRSKHIIADGTFKYAPAEAQQIYRIFGLIGGEANPFAVVLMTKRTRADYELMWNTLRESLNAVPGNLQIQYAHFDC